MKRVLILSVLTLGITTLAHAQATRTWVSGVGDDANPCSRTAPCKTFAGAISKTASPGIINCLDPGGFGAVTITKSVTIDCTGTMGSVLASGTQGIVINALTTDRIVLRDIDINGAGTTLGTNGVNVVQAGSVKLYDVRVASFSSQGVETTNTSNTIPVSIEHCQLLNNGANGAATVSSGTGTSQLFVSNSHLAGNLNGMDIAGNNNTGIVNNCTIVKNTSSGIVVEQTLGGLYVEASTVAINGTGFTVGTGGATPTIRISHSAVVNNGVGFAGSGTSACFGNNMVTANGAPASCSAPNQTQQ